MRLGISTKAILLAFCMIVFFGLALGYFVIRYQSRVLRLELNERVTVLMNNLSFNSEYPLLIEDKEAIVRLTKGILAQRDIVFCRIEDKSKNFFYEEGSKEVGPISEYTTTIVSKTAAEELGEELILGIPKELEEEIGRVYLCVSHSGFKEKLNKAKRIIAAIIIPFIITTCLAIYLLLKRILGLPIKQLVKATEKISQGNLNDRVPIETHDEIGVLAASFNKMTKDLQESTVSRKELEQRVVERTRELAEERQNLENTVQVRTRELRESLEKVEDANLLLEHANRAKTQFLSSMSHELRTPLNVVIGFTDLLSEQLYGNLNDKQMKYVSEIGNSAEHLLSLINDLLDVSKIDAGAMELEMEDISFDELINTIVSMMNSQFRKKKINVKTSIEPTLPVVTADRRKCKQILMNLLSNAFKFTPEEGRVEICAVYGGDFGVRIEVRDTGIGIAADKIDKIFSEFYQVENVRDEQLGGTGIGLALTRRLVELHGGKIGVESKLCKGSTFWFTLPLKKLLRKEPSEQKEAEEVLKENGAPKGRRILIVEDNEVNLAMAIEMLNVHKHRVVVARNGQEAIEMAKQHKPELILMDIRMPVMDGLEATQRLRAIPEFANTPIIAMTASTGAEAEKTHIAKGCTTHLAKPIHVKQLFAVLKKYLSIEN
ncbi:MAG TPA: ATP-binding protein [Candidatus Brocadiia bacterium]|nr:response regulator [Planctomycetota bacterium]MDO8093364.1 ATP-binding protein [Candidatus Brocadiales bacterium]